VVGVPSSELLVALAERFEVYELGNSPDPAAIPRDAATVQVLVTGGTHGASRSLMEALPRLELIAVHGVGLDKLDLAHARARGIKISNTPDVLTDDVADLAVGLVYAVLRRITLNDQLVRAGRWEQGVSPLRGRRVTCQAVGILGLGKIGRAIAKRLSPTARELMYHNRSRVDDVPYRYVPSVLQLAEQSDILIVAASGGPASSNLIDAAVLDALGSDGVLINVARGSIVDEPALLAALRDGRIAGAGLDVFASEPHVPHDLTALPNVVLQPHQGSATVEARRDMARLVLANIEAHLGNGPLVTPVS
jgi:lactate dehydrogenase-like 2-hydroxyacid dehydrogenase